MAYTPINMRLYRRFDADLIALQANGIPVNVLAEELLIAYTEGRRIKLLPEYCAPIDISKKRSIHLTVKIKTPEVNRLIMQIVPGFRNQFCKSLIRDALVFDPLWVYFKQKEYIDNESERITSEFEKEEILVLPYGLKRKEYVSLINGSEVKRRKKTVQTKPPTPSVVYKPKNSGSSPPDMNTTSKSGEIKGRKRKERPRPKLNEYTKQNTGETGADTNNSKDNKRQFGETQYNEKKRDYKNGSGNNQNTYQTKEKQQEKKPQEAPKPNSAKDDESVQNFLEEFDSIF